LVIVVYASSCAGSVRIPIASVGATVSEHPSTASRGPWLSASTTPWKLKVNDPVVGGGAQVRGERGLGLPREAVGLGCVQATLARHGPCGGDTAGMDGEHGIVVSFEGGLDVANDEEMVVVAAGRLGGERVEAGCGRVVPSAKIVQYSGDVGQW